MFARTARLLLRPGWAEDAQALAAALGDPMVCGNLASVPSPLPVLATMYRSRLKMMSPQPAPSNTAKMTAPLHCGMPIAENDSAPAAIRRRGSATGR